MRYFYLDLEDVPYGEDTNIFIVRAEDHQSAKEIMEVAWGVQDSFELEEIEVCNDYFRLVLEGLHYIDEIADLYV